MNSYLLLPAVIAVSAAPLKSGISITEPRGVNIEVLPETIIDTNLSLEGDFFSALISKHSAELLKIPVDSRLIGKITQIKAAENFSRDTQLKIHVNKIMLPDGSLVKASADFISDANLAKQKSNPVTKALKTTVKAGSKLSASAAVGAVDSVQYAGLAPAIATSGISVAVGGALGLGAGLIGLMTERGEELISSGFDPINLKLESDFSILEDMPVMYQKLDPMNINLLGIDMKVNKISKSFSNNYGDFLLLNIELVNNSPQELFIGDFLLSSDRHIVPLLSNPLITNDTLSSLETKTSKSCHLAFTLGDIKRNDRYQLVLLDPITQEIIANTNIDFKKFL